VHRTRGPGHGDPRQSGGRPNKGMQLSRGAWSWGILSCRLGEAEAPVKVGPLAADPQCCADQRR